MNSGGNSVPSPVSWLSAWPDAFAFGGGLALAWWFQWQVRDLVWSLWLSSLLVGYAMIVWRIFGPVLTASRAAATGGTSVAASVAPVGLYLLGGLFLLAFFTVHFGMFHFVHSVFLNLFFPVLPTPTRGFATASLYLHVLGAYWPFVPVAAIAERRAFLRPAPPLVGPGLGGAAKPKGGDALMEPYRNVMRMHGLIFFFAFAHFARLENFLVYAFVYAVYFFPWRLLKRPSSAAAA
ncbi:MAG TPA: DUF6498-containing protein [Opitutaceae bacterium]|nr:DUF6498-containing protein [Opitutaceae bacterium]